MSGEEQAKLEARVAVEAEEAEALAKKLADDEAALAKMRLADASTSPAPVEGSSPVATDAAEAIAPGDLDAVDAAPQVTVDTPAVPELQARDLAPGEKLEAAPVPPGMTATPIDVEDGIPIDLTDSEPPAAVGILHRTAVAPIDGQLPDAEPGQTVHASIAVRKLEPGESVLTEMHEAPATGEPRIEVPMVKGPDGVARGELVNEAQVRGHERPSWATAPGIPERLESLAAGRKVTAQELVDVGNEVLGVVPGLQPAQVLKVLEHAAFDEKPDPQVVHELAQKMLDAGTHQRFVQERLAEISAATGESVEALKQRGTQIAQEALAKDGTNMSTDQILEALSGGDKVERVTLELTHGQYHGDGCPDVKKRKFERDVGYSYDAHHPANPGELLVGIPKSEADRMVKGGAFKLVDK